MDDLIKSRVARYYWEHDINCAGTVLRVLAECFDIALHPQVLDAALGLHGAGGHGAQCGLVEGTLLFLGIAGKARGFPEKRIVESCSAFAREFEQRFGSLRCSQLRPQGFRPELPPHLCEHLTCQALALAARFVYRYLKDA